MLKVYLMMRERESERERERERERVCFKEQAYFLLRSTCII